MSGKLSELEIIRRRVATARRSAHTSWVAALRARRACNDLASDFERFCSDSGNTVAKALLGEVQEIRDQGREAHGGASRVDFRISQLAAVMGVGDGTPGFRKRTKKGKKP